MSRDETVVERHCATRGCGPGWALFTIDLVVVGVVLAGFTLAAVGFKTGVEYILTGFVFLLCDCAWRAELFAVAEQF